MSSGLKGNLIVLGGGLSLAVLICGTGLLIKSFTARGDQAATAESPAPPTEKENASTEKKAAHGEAPKNAHGSPAKEGKAGQEEKKGHTPKAEPEAKTAHGAKAQPEAKAAHGAKPEPETKAAHGKNESEAASQGTAKTAKEHGTPSGEPELWRSKGDAAMVCGRYDDAVRHYALALKIAPAEKKADFELRLADATRQSPSLPQQLREQKALEIYSRILAEEPRSNAADHAQFNAGTCLAAQARWQEALDAFNQYEKSFPLGAHRAETRFRRAEVLATLGNPDQAAEILEKLLENEHDAARKSRTILLLARVKLQMVRSESFGREHEQSLPETHREEIQRKPKAPDEQAGKASQGQSPDHETPEKAEAPAHVSPAPTGIPEVQWAVVKRCVETGNLREAQRLLKPWLENNKDQAQSAVLWGHWARLLKLTAERGALDVPLEGILISSRAE